MINSILPAMEAYLAIIAALPFSLRALYNMGFGIFFLTILISVLRSLHGG